MIVEAEEGGYLHFDSRQSPSESPAPAKSPDYYVLNPESLELKEISPLIQTFSGLLSHPPAPGDDLPPISGVASVRLREGEQIAEDLLSGNLVDLWLAGGDMADWRWAAGFSSTTFINELYDELGYIPRFSGGTVKLGDDIGYDIGHDTLSIGPIEDVLSIDFGEFNYLWYLRKGRDYLSAFLLDYEVGIEEFDEAVRTAFVELSQHFEEFDLFLDPRAGPVGLKFKIEKIPFDIKNLDAIFFARYPDPSWHRGSREPLFCFSVGMMNRAAFDSELHGGLGIESPRHGAQGLRGAAEFTFRYSFEGSTSNYIALHREYSEPPVRTLLLDELGLTFEIQDYTRSRFELSFDAGAEFSLIRGGATWLYFKDEESYEEEGPKATFYLGGRSRLMSLGRLRSTIQYRIGLQIADLELDGEKDLERDTQTFGYDWSRLLEGGEPVYEVEGEIEESHDHESDRVHYSVPLMLRIASTLVDGPTTFLRMFGSYTYANRGDLNMSRRLNLGLLAYRNGGRSKRWKNPFTRQALGYPTVTLRGTYTQLPSSVSFSGEIHQYDCTARAFFGEVSVQGLYLLDERLLAIEESWFPDKASLRNLAYLRHMPRLGTRFLALGFSASGDRFGPMIQWKKKSLFLEATYSANGTHPGGSLLVVLDGFVAVDTKVVFGRYEDYRDYIWDLGFLISPGRRLGIGLRSTLEHVDGDSESYVQVRGSYMW